MPGPISRPATSKTATASGWPRQRAIAAARSSSRANACASSVRPDDAPLAARASLAQSESTETNASSSRPGLRLQSISTPVDDGCSVHGTDGARNGVCEHALDGLRIGLRRRQGGRGLGEDLDQAKLPHLVTIGRPRVEVLSAADARAHAAARGASTVGNAAVSIRAGSSSSIAK